jgi:hypothetical protein
MSLQPVANPIETLHPGANSRPATRPCVMSGAQTRERRSKRYKATDFCAHPFCNRVQRSSPGWRASLSRILPQGRFPL